MQLTFPTRSSRDIRGDRIHSQDLRALSYGRHAGQPDRAHLQATAEDEPAANACRDCDDMKLRQPRPAPKVYSPQAAAWASFTTTGFIPVTNVSRAVSG